MSRETFFPRTTKMVTPERSESEKKPAIRSKRDEIIAERLRKAEEQARALADYQVTQAELREKEKALRALDVFLSQLMTQNELLESYLKKVSKTKYEEVMKEVEASQKMEVGGKVPSFYEIRKHATVMNQASQGGEKLTETDLKQIAAQMMDALSAERQELVKEYEEAIEAEQAQLDEIDMDIDEVKKETYEFKRDVIVGGENPRTGKIALEKVERFLMECVANKEMQLQKLQRNNKMLKHNTIKLETALKNKEDKGEMLNAIDFDQLKIENQQFLEKIDERNSELLKLKLTTGRTVQVMNSLKAKLQQLMDHQQFLRDAIADREESSHRVVDDLVKVRALSESVERQVKDLKLEKDDPEAPQVMEYIRTKADVHDLEKAVLDWERKREILLLERQRLRPAKRGTTRLSSQGNDSRPASRPAKDLSLFAE